LNPTVVADPIIVVTDRELVLHGVGQPEVEFDLEDEKKQVEVKSLAMVQFYSRKKFNASDLFEEMRVTWGLQSMKPV
jgi:hypothetical protein